MLKCRVFSDRFLFLPTHTLPFPNRQVFFSPAVEPRAEHSRAPGTCVLPESESERRIEKAATSRGSGGGGFDCLLVPDGSLSASLLNRAGGDTTHLFHLSYHRREIMCRCGWRGEGWWGSYDRSWVRLGDISTTRIAVPSSWLRIKSFPVRRRKTYLISYNTDLTWPRSDVGD